MSEKTSVPAGTRLRESLQARAVILTETRVAAAARVLPASTGAASVIDTATMPAKATPEKCRFMRGDVGVLRPKPEGDEARLLILRAG